MSEPHIIYGFPPTYQARCDEESLNAIRGISLGVALGAIGWGGLYVIYRVILWLAWTVKAIICGVGI